MTTNKAIELLAKVIEKKQLSADEANGLLRVITDYTYALDLLDRYVLQTLQIEDTSGVGTFQITYQIAKKAIKELGNHIGAKVFLENKKMSHLKVL